MFLRKLEIALNSFHGSVSKIGKREGEESQKRETGESEKVK